MDSFAKPLFSSFSCKSMPCSGCSSLQGVRHNFKKYRQMSCTKRKAVINRGKICKVLNKIDQVKNTNIYHQIFLMINPVQNKAPLSYQNAK